MNLKSFSRLTYSNSNFRLDVLCVGGGGGGRSAVEDGGDGGDSHFGNYLYAGGGKGGRAFGKSNL